MKSLNELNDLDNNRTHIASLFYRLKVVQCRLRCFGSITIDTEKKATRYTYLIDIAIYQKVVILIIISLIRITLNYTDEEAYSKFYFPSSILLTLSSVFAILNLLT
mmetsp:Transcript_27998/g.5112  ORF Transcript_27998/g.5112 Transcript_27998/m.5112 type:complete len:106 (-) Transcript_27998:208-525(-)